MTCGLGTFREFSKVCYRESDFLWLSVKSPMGSLWMWHLPHPQHNTSHPKFLMHTARTKDMHGVNILQEGFFESVYDLPEFASHPYGSQQRWNEGLRVLSTWKAPKKIAKTSGNMVQMVQTAGFECNSAKPFHSSSVATTWWTTTLNPTFSVASAVAHLHFFGLFISNGPLGHLWTPNDVK